MIQEAKTEDINAVLYKVLGDGYRFEELMHKKEVDRFSVHF
jgi:hypothetical protein